MYVKHPEEHLITEQGIAHTHLASIHCRTYISSAHNSMACMMQPHFQTRFQMHRKLLVGNKRTYKRKRVISQLQFFLIWLPSPKKQKKGVVTAWGRKAYPAMGENERGLPVCHFGIYFLTKFFFLFGKFFAFFVFLIFGKFLVFFV